MPKIKSPETFVPNTVLTAAANQNHVDGAYPLPGFITEHPSLSVANTLANDDKFLISDTSDSAILKKANVSEILNSGLAITTGSITGNAAADLVVTPAVGQKVDIVGNLEADDINVTDDLTVADDATISGDLTVTGLSTFNGTSNFVGAIQVNGVTTTIGAGGLLSVVEENIPYALGTTANTLHNLFTSASYTKPAGEIWIVELDFNSYTANNTNVHYRVTNSADSVLYVSSFNVYNSSGTIRPHLHRFYLDSANTHSGTFVLRFKSSQANIAVSPTSTQAAAYPDGSKGTVNKFRIYKYKA